MENQKNILPNGCSFSDPFIHPDLSKISAINAMKETWFVELQFFDPAEIAKYPNGFPWRKKKLAKYKSFGERKEAAEILLDEMRKAVLNGYNPMPHVKTFKDISEDEYSPNLYVLTSLELALKNHKKNITDPHYLNILSCLRKIKKVFIDLGYDSIKIKDIELHHIKSALEKCELSANSYNKYKIYLSVLFSELCANSCLVQNPCQHIKNRKHLKEDRNIISYDKFLEVYNYLVINHSGFANYAMIFFMSGCRSTEMTAIKKKDVDIKNQEFTITVKKRKNYVREKRAIIPDAIPYWMKQLRNCEEDDYIFGVGFYPEKRDKPIVITSTSVYWRKHVKKKLGLSFNFYDLKRLFLDLVDSKKGIEYAQRFAGHLHSKTSEIYTTTKKKRELQELKEFNLN